MRFSKPYLVKTKNGYKRIRRRLPDKTVKTRKIGYWERLVAPLLLVLTLSTGATIMYSQPQAQPQAQAEVTEAGRQTPEFVITEPVKYPKNIEWKTGLATAYSCGNLTTQAEIRMNCPSLFNGEPKTANGTTPIANKTMACDKANMGRTFFIRGQGMLTCSDTGGAIKGAGRFDIYLDTVEEARQFGKQTVEYYEVTSPLIN